MEAAVIVVIIMIAIAAKMEIVGPAVIVFGNGACTHQYKGEDRDESESFGQTH
jgi:hypothetical protein